MKINVFMPEYMSSFKCVGSECIDTCCAGWDINIDEDSFNRYENSKGQLKDLVKEKYIENKEEHDFFNHGFMIVGKENKCPFLNENMLCDIHGECGEKHLCITCKSYPRVFNIVDGIYEKSGLPSCEEVCVKAFLNKDKIEFKEFEEEVNENEIEVRRIIDTEAFEESDSLLQYFWDLRVASINIMQNREYKIEERLNILKNLYTKIEELHNNDDFESIEELLDAISEGNIDFDMLKKGYVKFEDNFLKEIATDELVNTIRSTRLKVCVEEYRKWFFEAKNLSEVVAEFDKKSNELEEYYYILENYLVNQIFKDLIPFNKGQNLNMGIKRLINSYRIIKAYIIGISINSKEKVNEKQIIRVIQCLSKDIEHNKVFCKILD